MMVAEDDTGERFRRVIFAIVVVVWVCNFLAGLVPSLEYKQDPMINGIFLTIAGCIYGVSSFRKPPES